MQDVDTDAQGCSASDHDKKKDRKQQSAKKLMYLKNFPGNDKERSGVKKLIKLELKELQHNHKNLLIPMFPTVKIKTPSLFLPKDLLILIEETMKGIEGHTKQSESLSRFLKVCVKGGQEKRLVRSTVLGTMYKIRAKKIIANYVSIAMRGHGDEDIND